MGNGRPAWHVCESSSEPARGLRHVFAPPRLRSGALAARAVGRRVRADASVAPRGVNAPALARKQGCGAKRQETPSSPKRRCTPWLVRSCSPPTPATLTSNAAVVCASGTGWNTIDYLWRNGASRDRTGDLLLANRPLRPAIQRLQGGHRARVGGSPRGPDLVTVSYPLRSR